MKNIILMILFINTVVFANGLTESSIHQKYFKECDMYLNNNTFKSCYNFKAKGITASFAFIYGENVDTLNIKQRPNFYEDTRIPEQYRVKNIDYLYINMDKGHIQSDASNDYSEASLKETYALSNVVPMYPRTNRISYLHIEKRERELAKEFGTIKALTLVNYTTSKINDMFIPKDFIKVFFTQGYSECYKIPNDNNSYKIEQMKISCSEI